MEQFPQLFEKEEKTPEKTEHEQTEQEPLDEEYFGKKFKEILAETATETDQRINETASIIGDSEYLRAGRNARVLQESIRKLTAIPGFPENIRIEIGQNLRVLDMYNPDMDRHQYLHATDSLDKELKAETHNLKLSAYTEMIKKIFNALEDVLPQSMVTELRARGGMFYDVLNAIDRENQEKS